MLAEKGRTSKHYLRTSLTLKLMKFLDLQYLRTKQLRSVCFIMYVFFSQLKVCKSYKLFFDGKTFLAHFLQN